MPPDMMLTEKIIELRSVIKHMHDNDAYMRRKFARLIPDLASGSWEDIWEIVRAKFDQDKKPEADPNCEICKGTGKGSIPGSCCDCYWIKETK